MEKCQRLDRIILPFFKYLEFFVSSENLILLGVVLPVHFFLCPVNLINALLIIF